MTGKLTGRSALLQKEVERLEREIERFAISGVADLADIQPQLADHLSQLRNELKRELETKRVVVLGTIHELQKNGDKKTRTRVALEVFD
ncbi:MAG: hypothetical protein ACLPND_13495 [Candidatus Korobacteraceae bacterium]